jgi:hypothetical protein
MDIMNNMTVSTSKLTFSLIAIATLLISGSGFMVQEVSAADAPEFTARHINTTATILDFDQKINGTLRVLDFSLKASSVAVAGSPLTEVTINNITNGTTSGLRIEEGGYVVPSYSDTATAANKAALGAGTSGFINNSKVIVLIHDTIDTDSTYFVNYTGNVALNNNVLRDGSLSHTVSGAVGFGGDVLESVAVKYVKIGSNATAADWISPTIVSAEILKSNPQQVKITMSETVKNINSTAAAFSFVTAGGGNDAVSQSTFFNSTSKYIYVNLQSPVNPLDLLTLSYNTGNALPNYWISDGTNTNRHGPVVGGLGGGSTVAAATNGGDAGNRSGNFTSVTVTNWLQVGYYGDVTTCYDCIAPIVTEVKVSLDSSMPIKVTDDNQVHINAGVGDTVAVMVTVADNLGADTVPFAGLYTNFGDTPDNLYYANNFDSAKQMSTSYYEWNVRNDDIAFDNDGAITWADATAKVNPDRTQTFTYTMTINDSVDSSQVWVDIADKAGNYGKIALPITLEVSGAPGLTFASDDSQKVVSFFNESILLAIVSQWTSTSSDDASNVEQLSSVLGIENQLPTWTTDLASWVADDKIDVADMIVAVEYVINQ